MKDPVHFRSPDCGPQQDRWINPVDRGDKRHFREHIRWHEHYIISTEKYRAPQIQHLLQRRMAC